jgi:transcriptional regulator with XRE-family HTH domain
LSDLRVRVGRRLRRLRHQRNLSQERLAERAGLSYKFVGEIERGVGNPTILTLARLATALDVDVVELLGPPPDEAAEENLYAISERHLHTVRDALAAVETVIREVDPPRRRTSPGKRRNDPKTPDGDR